MKPWMQWLLGGLAVAALGYGGLYIYNTRFAPSRRARWVGLTVGQALLDLDAANIRTAESNAFRERMSPRGPTAILTAREYSEWDRLMHAQPGFTPSVAGYFR